jgi:hypothetical protein
MSQMGVGVIEGFFGPEWSWPARHHFCENMRSYGGSYYIYAPKRDSYLRKNWTSKHPAETWSELRSLGEKCRSSGIAFGVGLSPFEFHDNWNQTTKNLLGEKIKRLEELQLDYLGIFFDDMKGAPDLAEKQIDILDFVAGVSAQKILFCPTYYSDDPVLDKVFGVRPDGYLEKIAELSLSIEIFWTGSKVIPKSITAEELQRVTAILKRKPFLWENYFANDGPRQCKFLKILPFDGRPQAAFESASGWAFNLMNQPLLSEMVFAASVQVLKNGASQADALENEMNRLKESGFFKNHNKEFAENGLDSLSPEKRNDLKAQLTQSPLSNEIRDWLDGKYTVGPECLTD